MGKRSNKIKLIIIFMLITCTLFAPYAFAGIEIVETKDIPQTENWKRTSNLLIEKRLMSSASFDLRTQIDIQIKNQKTTQDCWAFASNTVLETNLALRNNEIYDFSERHMVYSTSKTFTDGTNALGHNKEVAGGGNEIIAMAYYTSGRGPVLETEMPFSENETPIALSEIEGKTVQKQVTDYIIFPTVIKYKDTTGNMVYTDPTGQTTYTEADMIEIRNSIKNHIITYGAVTAMTLSGSGYSSYYNYNSEYPSFYCNNPNYVPNHQVAIIGWNDNYLVSDFNASNQPSGPGAYLVMNSYGTEKYPEGCYYISYEDCYVEAAAMGVINAEDVDYDNIYQYDPLGPSTNVCIEEEQVLYGANVFEKDKTSVELLTEIGIASSIDQNFELYINSKNGDLTKLQKIETEQTKLRTGYTTVKIKTPIELSGEKFAVAIKYIGQNQKAYMAIEGPNTDFWLTATSNENESYYSTDGQNWTDMKQDIINSNICIKAFTKIKEYNIISESYLVGEEIIYRVPTKTNLEVFKTKIHSSGNIKILRNNIEMQDGDIITTDTAITVGNDKTYKVVVTGDITGTGDISSTDISKLKLHLVGVELLNEIQQKAADMNNTGSVTLTDLSQMKSALVGLINV